MFEGKLNCSELTKVRRQNLPAYIHTLCLLLTILGSHAYANTPAVNDEIINVGSQYKLQTLGAYRIKQGKFGSSRFAWTVGPIAVADDDTIIYVAGHAHHFSVGGFSLTAELGLGSVEDLPIAPNVIPFAKVTPPFKPQGSANQITGLEILDQQLLVMSDEYYDADTNNNEFFVLFQDRLNLADSSQLGFFNLSARSHASGWMSKIPEPLATDLGALYLAGSASNIPINGRHSIGPSMFTWFPFYMDNTKPAGRPLVMAPLIDYSLAHPLHPDLNNTQRNNDLWTELSYAAYGFISPNQKHYIVLGYSGGHESGIGYKITQENGYQCGGFCANDYRDYYNHYWIYSVEDIKRSHRGELQPHELRPVEYGRLPFLDHQFLIIGADYNHHSNRLYLSVRGLDKTQNRFESQPIIWVFELLEQV